MGYYISPLFIIVIVLVSGNVKTEKQRRIKRCTGAENSNQESNPEYTAIKNYNKGWPKQCATGTKQSPIALVESQAILKSADIQFNGYENPLIGDIVNSGHAVKVHIKGNTLPYISGSAVDSKEYNLNNIHFHWNSEHTINNHTFPLEAHFVHYEKQYSSLVEALNFNRGVVVLSVMYDVEENCADAPFPKLIPEVEKIAKNINVPTPLRKQIKIDDFLPTNKGLFYMYDGSLTTPNCNEGIYWIVFETPKCIEGNQLKRMTRIYDKHKKQVLKNKRYLQKLNKRKVYYSTILK